MHLVFPLLRVLGTVAHALDTPEAIPSQVTGTVSKTLCLCALALGHSTVLCSLKDLSCEVVWSNGYPSTFTKKSDFREKVMPQAAKLPRASGSLQNT